KRCIIGLKWKSKSVDSTDSMDSTFTLYSELKTLLNKPSMVSMPSTTPPFTIKNDLLSQFLKPDGYFYCPLCPFTCGKTEDFEKHLLMHKKAKRLRFECNLCGSQFAHQEDLDNHVKACHGGHRG
ncbi:MAG: hypothetical protein QXR42_08050, partial [Candidatus Bathyarchaeia archaeon]